MVDRPGILPQGTLALLGPPAGRARSARRQSRIPWRPNPSESMRAAFARPRVDREGPLARRAPCLDTANGSRTWSSVAARPGMCPSFRRRSETGVSRRATGWSRYRCLPAQLLLPQQPDDLLLVKAADPHRTPPLGHPVAYVTFALGRKTGLTPGVSCLCRKSAPRCRKNTLVSRRHAPHR